jgi:outer membrane protein assembly factor BamA
MLVAAQTELILPIPEKWRSRSRLTLFYDIGNVFSTGGVTFTAKDQTTPIDYDFDFGNLKQAVGISAQWLAPLGLFRFSYGFPLNADDPTLLLYGDETEQFQFSIGGAF